MALYLCKNCGYGSATKLGRCPECGKFNTFELQEKEETKHSLKVAKAKPLSTTSLHTVNAHTSKRIPTGIAELDRVLGGGFIPGEVILLTGEPGIGKSTLLLQALAPFKTLYISGEESLEQIKHRAQRLKVDTKNILGSNDTYLGSMVKGVEDLAGTIDLMVIDSLQTISTQTDAPYGSPAVLRDVIETLVNLAKHYKLPTVIIGHVTKEGDIAGPKTVEHMVDAVLHFEGEETSGFRILRSRKNRYGNTDEIGVFEMHEEGLREVTNPLAFIEEGAANAPGKAIVGVMEGMRTMFYEIQALAVNTTLAIPRRVTKGIDTNRLLLLLAVIRKYLHIPLESYDIYVNVAGGVRITSPSADLGIIAAVISSVASKGSSAQAVFVGEVGLLGDVRTTYKDERILTEAKRLGFKHIFSKQTIPSVKDIKKVLG